MITVCEQNLFVSVSSFLFVAIVHFTAQCSAL